MSRFVLSSLALCVVSYVPVADDAPKAKTVEQIAALADPAVAVLTVAGRDGKGESLGAGFVVSADGLIAANFHVIDVGRGVTAELADGKRDEATAVHAADRERDLAVIRIDAKGLTPLELGDSKAMKDGQAVVAVGNPEGLKRGVVTGVLSGRRERDGALRDVDGLLDRRPAGVDRDKVGELRRLITQQDR